MTRPSNTLRLRAVALIAAVGLLSHCAAPVTGSKTDPAEIAAERALLRALATDVIRPSVVAFASQTVALQAAVTAWCPTLAGDEATAAKAAAAAQTAWLAAATAWQRLAPMAVGPLADADVSESIYSWPLVNPCAVDQGVNTLRTAGVVDVAKSLPNRKGLDALETLLFRTELESTCPPQAAPQGWDALTPAERRAARCAYAVKVAEALQTRAQSLKAAWSDGDANYVEVLANAGAAGTAGSVWASSHAALNAVSDASLSLEVGLKGRRLGAPLGIAANPCGTIGVACSQALESPWAHRGTELLRANLAGGRAILLGASDDAPGFDDWLIRKGAAPAAATLVTRLNEARDALDALPTPLHDALAKKPETVKAAYAAIGALTHHMETQLLVALSLQVPAAVAGDAD